MPTLYLTSKVVQVQKWGEATWVVCIKLGVTVIACVAIHGAETSDVYKVVEPGLCSRCLVH